MSGANYSFLPWLRAGMASELAPPDGAAGETAPRAEVDVTLVVDAAGEPRQAPAHLALFGPGEVAAIDPRVIDRVAPKPGELDAEPNELVLLEIGQPDFPWRYTPAGADGASRVPPWLVLAVLTAEEITSEEPAGTDGRLAAVTVGSAAALPFLDQSWAWAHVQVEGFDAASEVLEDVIRTEPRRVRSRLLSSRRLAPRTPYTAVLVPAFERGRRAGLREPLAEDVDGLAPAWAPDATDVRLPVYYRWEFQTGEAGDFEQLARRLRARRVGPDIGQRLVDVRTPDPALPPAATAPLTMQGALVAPETAPAPWDPGERSTFVEQLATLLNAPADSLAAEEGPRTVAPPLWGRWHAARERLDPTEGAPPVWFHELNADPRLRATAGLGAEVVQRNDEQLMASAWDQVEGVLDANEALRLAQLARAAASKIHANHMAQLDTDGFLQVSTPLHARITASPVTVHERLRASPIPDGALDGQLRRLRRPPGPANRRLRRTGLAGADAADAEASPPSNLLHRLNEGELRPRPPLPPPEGALVPGRLAPDERARTSLLARPGGARSLAAVVAALLVLAVVLLLLAPPLGAALVVVAMAAGIWLAWASRRATRRAVLAEQERAELRQRSVLGAALTAPGVRTLAPPRGWRPGVAAWLLEDSERPAVVHRPVAIGGDPAEDPETAATVRGFRTAFVDLVDQINAPPRPRPELHPVDLPQIQETLLTGMDPGATIVAGIQHRLHLADWVTWEAWDADDPLEPIIVAPEFDRPMYEPLKELSQDWLLPGAGTIPADTVTLVVANQRFVEAYMAGLSHEMARELLYHEYPTDQRGTYFRHFWDSRGAIAAGSAPADPDTVRDIGPIHGWEESEGLGANTGRIPPPPEDSLVLLVKGELLRRYPTTIVYAVETVLDGDGQRTLGTTEMFPLFQGRLEPDISFFGFPLVAAEARGTEAPTGDQGWYFVLAEHPTEPRFGLDQDNGDYGAKPTTWNDLNWAHLADDRPGLDALIVVDLTAALPDLSAVVPEPGDPPLSWRPADGSNGSDLAWITLQRPFRVAIHGSDMLPEEPA